MKVNTFWIGNSVESDAQENHEFNSDFKQNIHLYFKTQENYEI